MQSLKNKAQKYTLTLIDKVFYHTNEHKAVIVYDTHSTLSKLLAEAYQTNLPEAIFIDFTQTSPKEILEVFATLEASDMVILIQSTNFRLDAFRIRVELFKRKIKVLEHPHLSRMSEDEVETYIDALEYDEKSIKEVGKALKVKIDKAQYGMIESGGEKLFFPVGFEPTKMNIGDYAPMPNVGGQFPIGEVFTESKELRAVHGRVKLFAFADLSYKINVPKEPIILIIEEGKVLKTENSTPAFEEMLAVIREGEELVWVRELGFGLNRGMSKTKILSDVGSYERMCGVHLSLGRKHGMYAKKGFKRGDGKFHIDVFVDSNTVHLEEEIVFENEAWII